MKKQINLWFGGIFSVAILLFTPSCNNEESLLPKEETTIENDELEKREITPINLNVKVKNGSLVFENSKDLLYARDVLSNVDLASRLAWEESVGFKSLRRVYEKVLEDFNEESSFDLESATRDYGSIIDFSTAMPTLKNHDLLLSSILNSADHIIYVGEAVGTLNKEGSFWITNGDLNKLKEVLQNPEAETDLEAGVIIFRNAQRSPDRVDPRSCTVDADDIYVDTDAIQNGTNNGSTRLEAQFAFYPFRVPLPPNYIYFDYIVDVYMTGVSYRRKTCGCGWKTYPDDHIFSWNIEIGKGFTGPITTYSGQETHNSVQRANRFIFTHRATYPYGTAFDEQFYYLNKIEFDTRHTTDNLDLPGISYMCQ